MRPTTQIKIRTTLLAQSISVPGLYDTTFQCDAKGRPTLIRTDTRETEIVYNAQGFVETITDPEEHVTGLYL